MARTRFPHDLLQLQIELNRTYTALSAQPTTSSPTVYRHRMIVLMCRLHAHPFWAQPGASTAARAELRRQARAHRWATAA